MNKEREDIEEIELLGGALRLRREGATVTWQGTGDPAKARERLIAQGAEAGAEAETRIDRLQDIVRRHDPIHLIAQVSIIATAGDPRRDDAAETFGNEAKVEYLTGLALSLAERGSDPADSQDVSDTWALLEELFELERKRLLGARGSARRPALRRANPGHRRGGQA